MAVGKKLFHIAIVTNFNIPEKLQDAMQVAEKLLQFGCHVTIPQRGQSRITAESPKLAEAITFLPFEKLYKNLDAVIVLGGDGTILESARYAALNGVPVIGMNLGRLGYLAELEMNEIMLLEKIVAGEYMVDERSLLKISIKSQKKGKIYCGYALNAVVVSNGSCSCVWLCWVQFSKSAPSTPHTGQSVSMLSSVQAVVQIQAVSAAWATAGK